MSQSAVVTALQCQLVNPKGTQEEEKYLWSTTHQTAATPYDEPQGSSGCEKHNILAPDRWTTFERNDFSEPRLLHLPIYREVLNSLIGNAWFSFSSVQFSSLTQLCPTLSDPMDCRMPGLPVHHQFLEFTQTHVLWIGDAIQPSHPLSFPSPLFFNLFQYQDLFQWVSSYHQMAKVLEFQLRHQSFQWTFRTDFL